MPTYKYRCKECQHELDMFQSMSDAPLVQCPSCSQPSLRRVVSGGLGVIFKGQGFYVNDSKGGGTKQDSGVASADSTDGTTSTASDGGGSGDGTANNNGGDTQQNSARGSDTAKDGGSAETGTAVSGAGGGDSGTNRRSASKANDNSATSNSGDSKPSSTSPAARNKS